MPDYVPLHDPGKAITRRASGTITAGQLVAVSGAGTVATATANTPSWLGVAGFDAVSGDNVTVFCESVQRLVAAGTITAGQNVDAAANGQAQAHTNGTNDYTIVGLALTSVTIGQLVEVSMKR